MSFTTEQLSTRQTLLTEVYLEEPLENEWVIGELERIAHRLKSSKSKTYYKQDSIFWEESWNT